MLGGAAGRSGFDRDRTGAGIVGRGCLSGTGAAQLRGEAGHRSSTGFTQGLVFHDGALFESTGRYGESRLNRIAMDGTVETLATLDGGLFGEGLTVLGGRLFQLTWRENRVLVYTSDGAPVREMANPKQGWGLTDVGGQLLFGDGSSNLFVADPDDFEVLRTIAVRSDRGEVPGLNELEAVGGDVFANVYGSMWIARISRATGCVEAAADMSPLLDTMTVLEKAAVRGGFDHVLNGIAFDQSSGTFFVTGKQWTRIFAGRFRK